MKIDMPPSTIFNPEIIAYLEANEFKRIDDATDKNIMHWHRESTLIEFNCGQLFIKAVQPEEPPYCAYYLRGFPPYDHVLFTFLMHSWGIISLTDFAVVKEKQLAKSITKPQHN